LGRKYVKSKRIKNNYVTQLLLGYSTFVPQKFRMKKRSIILAVAVLLSLCSSLKAQETPIVIVDEPSFRYVEFGFKFLPTVSSFSMKPASSGTVKGTATFGFGFGGSLAVNFTKHYGVQGEIIYNSLSQKYTDDDMEREINLRYINFPLMFSLNTGKGKQANLNVMVGPQFGMNIGSSFNTSSGNGTDTVTYVLATKKGDFGMAYGAGVEFMLNEIRTIRLDLGYRGIYGFTNINKTLPSENDDEPLFESAKVRTNSGYIGITFLF
jgi:opacity protein-like surface antigen